MHHILISILFLTPLSGLFAQANLVINPSFEETAVCPNQFGQLSNALGWYASRPSPDYFNSCAPLGSDVGTPNNSFGTQNASSGIAYAGFWARNLNEYREYLGSQLSNNLQIGVKYYVSLKVSLAPNPTLTQYCGVNNLGVLFSTNSFMDTVLESQKNLAHVYTSLIITDTLGWTTVTGSFIADSAYGYINIGNFFSDSLTDSIQMSGAYCEAYYFVDDICVSTDSIFAFNYLYLNTLERFKETDFLIYPNPFSDIIYVKSSKVGEPFGIRIFNTLGNEIFSKENVNNSVEYYPIPGFENNFLFIIISYNKRQLRYKFIKSNQI